MTSSITIKNTKPSSKLRWWLLLFSSLMTLGSYYSFDLPAALYQQFDDYMGKPDRFPILLSLTYTVYSVPNIVIPFFGGYLVDQCGVRVCLIMFSLAIALGQVVFSIGASYRSWEVMYLGRLLFGLGGETLGVASNAILSEWFQGQEVAFAFGISLSVGRLGSVANDFISPALSANLGLRFAVWFGSMLCGLSVLATFCVVYVDGTLFRPLSSPPPSPSSSRGERHHRPSSRIMKRLSSSSSAASETLEVVDEDGWTLLKEPLLSTAGQSGSDGDEELALPFESSEVVISRREESITIEESAGGVRTRSSFTSENIIVQVPGDKSPANASSSVVADAARTGKVVAEKNTVTTSTYSGHINSNSNNRTVDPKAVNSSPSGSYSGRQLSPSFWILVVLAVFFYSCILPFNNIALSILLERNYFIEPPSSCRLSDPYACQNPTNGPVDCPDTILPLSNSSWAGPARGYAYGRSKRGFVDVFAGGGRLSGGGSSSGSGSGGGNGGGRGSGSSSLETLTSVFVRKDSGLIAHPLQFPSAHHNCVGDAAKPTPKSISNAFSNIPVSYSTPFTLSAPADSPPPSQSPLSRPDFYFRPPLPHNVTIAGRFYQTLTSADIDCSNASWAGPGSCTEAYCTTLLTAETEAAAVMSIPYLISALLCPLLGGLVDRFGFRGVAMMLSALLLCAVHAGLGLPALRGVGPIWLMIGQGIAYTAFAATVWPSIPLVVHPNSIGLAYGIASSLQNLGFSLVPLLIATVYSYSNFLHLIIDIIDDTLPASSQNTTNANSTSTLPIPSNSNNHTSNDVIPSSKSDLWTYTGEKHYYPQAEYFFLSLAGVTLLISLYLNVVDSRYGGGVLNRIGAS